MQKSRVNVTSRLHSEKTRNLEVTGPRAALPPWQHVQPKDIGSIAKEVFYK